MVINNWRFSNFRRQK